MPDEVSVEQVDLRVSKSLPVPVYQQLVERIESAIEDGRLSPGAVLPPIRALADELGINQMTVAKAYKVLASKGIVRGQSGGGTRVLKQGPTQSRPQQQAFGVGQPERYLALMGELGSAPGVIALTDAYPRFAAADVALFRECLDRALAKYGIDLFCYGPPAGKFELRALLADVLRKAEIHVQADDLILTSGAQQALDLSARLLLKPGDKVVVESPCYFGALELFRALGAEILELPVSEEGISSPEFRRICETHAPKAFYTIPTAHNPTGITTPDWKRGEILEAAREHGVAVIEDDYSPELFFEKDRPRSYYAMAGGSVDVFYVRSLGKMYLPGVRLGFLLPPATRFSSALQLKRAADMHGPLVLQNAAELYLRSRIGEGLLAETKTILANARLLYSELQRHLPKGCGTRMISGGLSFWIALPQPVANEELYFAAIRHSVAFALGSSFTAEGGDSSTGIRISFGQLDQHDIAEGGKRLGAALSSVFGAGGRDRSYLV